MYLSLKSKVLAEREVTHWFNMPVSINWSADCVLSCMWCVNIIDCSDDQAAVDILLALLKMFPPTAGGGKGQKKRKKISPQQAFPLLVREEEVRLTLIFCSTNLNIWS